MSRATAWADGGPKPSDLRIDDWTTAWVEKTDSAVFCVMSRAIYAPAHATLVARWILATFDDEAQP